MFICTFSLYTLSMGKKWFNITKNWTIWLQLELKHIHKVNFYPSDKYFTQALLVMLVTNMISGGRGPPNGRFPWLGFLNASLTEYLKLYYKHFKLQNQYIYGLMKREMVFWHSNYLSKVVLQALLVFVQIAKCICSNFKMYLFKLHNIFVVLGKREMVVWPSNYLKLSLLLGLVMT